MVDDVEDVESGDDFVLVANRFRKVWTSLSEKGEVQHHARRWRRGEVVDPGELPEDGDFQRLVDLGAVRKRSEVEAEQEAAEADAYEGLTPEDEDAESQSDEDVEPDSEPEPDEDKQPGDPTEGDGGDAAPSEGDGSEEPTGDGESTGDNENTESDSTSPEPEAEPIDYSAWDYADLQQEAKRLTNDGSGSKQALIDRLTAYQQVHSASADDDNE